MSKEDNDYVGANSLSNPPYNSEAEQNDNDISNLVNQTASPSTPISNQSNITAILDNPRIGSLEENFNVTEMTKSAFPR